MSVESLAFVDTNILVYAYNADAGAKHAAARDVLEDLWHSGRGSLSTQVLQEFYVTVTRKLKNPLSATTARRVVRAYGTWHMHSVDLADILNASEIAERHTISFRDALIVSAAQQVGARRILTEDLKPGQRIEGIVVENPLG